MLAELALRTVNGRPRYDRVWTLDGKTDTLREVSVPPRDDCRLCGSNASIHDIVESRYLSNADAA
jgi:hypothetical protein